LQVAQAEHAQDATDELNRILKGASDLFDLGRYEEVLEALDKAIELNPNDALAWTNRGKVLRNLGRYNEALEALDKAIELNPNDALAWNNRGAALHNLGRYDETLEAYDKAIELNPNYALARTNRGAILHSLGRYDEALESFDKAIELDPNYTDAWYNLGLALSDLGRSDEALDAYDKAIKLDPKYAKAWNNRGAVLIGLGRNDEALEACDKAIELDPNGVISWHTRAEILLALNRWNEGVAALDDALHRFARTDRPVTSDPKAILRSLFTRSDAEMWRERATDLITLYNRHEAVSALGQGLVRSIPALNSPMISDAAAQAWRDVWQEAGKDRDELKIPLRLLDAAVRYREAKDRRILLRLPIEERKVLEQILEESDSSKK
jgi:tetratricopeptide (TPR) repeat protein